MNTKLKIFITLTTFLMVFSLTKILPANQAKITIPSKTTFFKKSKELHIPFITNQGQVNGRVIYYASTFGGTVFVTHEGNIVYSLPCSKNTEFFSHNSTPVRRIALKEEIIGGNFDTIRGEEKTSTKVNYLKGKDSSGWKTNISAYNTVSLGEIYKGITLKLKATGNNVEKLFYIVPDANPELIKLRLEGANALRVNEGGELEVLTELGIVTYTKPFAYQEVDGKTVEVDVKYRIQNPAYRIKNTDVYGFELGKYDKTKELVIDPLLASTYIGGSEYDTINSISIGADSNIYITGSTSSPDFPTTSGVYDSSKSTYAEDVFIAKFDSELTSLLASTFLGGSSYDFGQKITINSGGNIIVTGYTSSSDFPTTSGAYSTSFNGSPYDVFVSVLDENLRTLYASTYLGGSSSDRAYSAIIDSSGYVYIAGYTSSSDFPTSSNAYNTSYTYEDAFVSKLNSDLSTLTASTYLGGSAYDRINAITIDSDGTLYVCGRTSSSDFPTTTDGYDTTYNDTGNIEDVFVAKLDTELTNLIASTYLGGSTYDYGTAITIDPDGNIFVAGSTGSSAFPTPDTNAYDTASNGGTDAFISKLSGNLSKLISSTFLGGSSEDSIEDISVDSTGNVYVTGKSASDDFPVTTNGYDTSFSGDSDAFIAKFNGDLMNLLASTLLGGAYSENGTSIAINSGGYIYVTGFTESDDFPTTDTAYETTYNDTGYAFVTKLDSDLSSALPVVTTSSATNVTTNSATLNSMVNANNFLTTAWFEYDTSSGSYRNSTSLQTISGSDDTSVTADLSGLSSGTTYYFRMAAENNEGTSYGDEASFTTLSVTDTISGNVVDSLGIAVADATVQCKGKSTKTKKRTTSGTTGFFELSNLEADTYTITAKKKGYKKTKQTVELEEDETDEIEIELVMKTKK
ncbi:MAG: hypothetical protein E3K37_16475 [Candidatus Kuenenia sp.]|nr:hypothetical protein [Candidatus Kuenenia hertensis]